MRQGGIGGANYEHHQVAPLLGRAMSGGRPTYSSRPADWIEYAELLEGENERLRDREEQYREFLDEIGHLRWFDEEMRRMDLVETGWRTRDEG